MIDFSLDSDNLELLYIPGRKYTLAVKLFQFSGIISPPLITVCFISMLWFAPCKPYAPGFYVLNQCAEYTEQQSGDNEFLLQGYLSNIYLVVVCSIIFHSLMKPILGCVAILFQLFFHYCLS